MSPLPHGWDPRHDAWPDGSPRPLDGVTRWRLRRPRTPALDALGEARSAVLRAGPLLAALRAAGALQLDDEAAARALAGTQDAQLERDERALGRWQALAPRPVPHIPGVWAWGVVLHSWEDGRVCSRDWLTLEEAPDELAELLAGMDPDAPLLFASAREAWLAAPDDHEARTVSVRAVQLGATPGDLEAA